LNSPSTKGFSTGEILLIPPKSLPSPLPLSLPSGLCNGRGEGRDEGRDLGGIKGEMKNQKSLYLQGFRGDEGRDEPIFEK
jgi:hypothetical protein